MTYIRRVKFSEWLQSTEPAADAEAEAVCRTEGHLEVAAGADNRSYCHRCGQVLAEVTPGDRQPRKERVNPERIT